MSRPHLSVALRGLLPIASSLALLACGGSQAAPAAPMPVPATDCTPATAHVASVAIAEVERLARESPSAYPQPTEAQARTQREALAGELDAACRGAGWSAEATACLGQASVDALESCYVHLDDAARTDVAAKIKQAVEALLAAARGA